MQKSGDLQVKKQSIYSKIISCIKGIFRFKKEIQVDTVIDTGLEGENKVKSDFKELIRSEGQESNELLRLQNRFRNNEISLWELSDEEVKELNLLYERQISQLKKRINEQKRQIYNMESMMKKV